MGIPAVKVSIEQVLSGFEQGEEGSIVRIGEKKVFRVRVMGRVVRKFVNEEATYGNIVLDDETGTIRAKFFSQNIEKLGGVQLGDLVEVLGRVRKFQDEVYIIVDELARFEDVNWELLRKLELLNLENPLEKKVLDEIRRGKGTEGELKELFGEEVTGILNTLMEKGEIYEASPGEFACVE